VLDSKEREQIAQSLVSWGCDLDQAARYADATNRAAVYSYDLEPDMSTPGESKRWHRATIKAAEKNDHSQVRQLISESRAEFEGRSELERQLLHDSGGLVDAIEALRKFCEEEVAKSDSRNRRTPRRATCRQLLTEELVGQWRIQFDAYPPYREGSDTTFLDILKRTIHLSEAIYCRGRARALVTSAALRSLTKRACAKDRRRIEQESQALN